MLYALALLIAALILARRKKAPLDNDEAIRAMLNEIHRRDKD